MRARQSVFLVVWIPESPANRIWKGHVACSLQSTRPRCSRSFSFPNPHTALVQYPVLSGLARSLASFPSFRDVAFSEIFVKRRVCVVAFGGFPAPCGCFHAPSGGFFSGVVWYPLAVAFTCGEPGHWLRLKSSSRCMPNPMHAAGGPNPPLLLLTTPHHLAPRRVT